MANRGIQNFAGPTHKILGIGAPITSSSVANPSNILCDEPHQLKTGQSVVISSHVGGTPDINATHVITVVDALNFTIPVNVTVGGTAGFAGLSGDFDGTDDDIVIELENAERYNEFTLMSGAGVMDVDVSLDGTNFAPIIALTDLESTTPATRVVVTVAGQLYAFYGTYKTVRVRQASAVEVGAAVLWCAQQGRE